MYKLWATIVKDFRLLSRDRVGLIMMFAMPILLVIVITSVQNSTFELVNDNKISLIIYNKDSAQQGLKLIQTIEKIGMFRILVLPGKQQEKEIPQLMHAKDALVALEIPENFSSLIETKAKDIAGRSLKDFGLEGDTERSVLPSVSPLILYYHPVLQQSFRQSINGALESALQVIQGDEIVRNLYSALHEKQIPATLENDILHSQVPITEIPVSRGGGRNIPNASQHNVPAWTLFAMFFIVISLGSSVVREKKSGSFMRLRTLPTSYMTVLFSKQITFLIIAFLQTAVIFAIGVWLFPHIGLPALNMPSDLGALLLVTLICGWCAVSYSICVGVFAETQEQANGFGAISIIILAAIGGLLVPSFAMPASFHPLMKMSPLHWGLEAYYGLFLEGGNLHDIMMNILSLLVITLLIQLITYLGLKRKNLI
ncbi:MAG: ABC transporter permease [Bacteroidetes bacterium]|nr:MAG: ABC transporter permease [Bacteroidota bacterium]